LVVLKNSKSLSPAIHGQKSGLLPIALGAFILWSLYNLPAQALLKTTLSVK